MASKTVYVLAFFTKDLKPVSMEAFRIHFANRIDSFKTLHVAEGLGIGQILSTGLFLDLKFYSRPHLGVIYTRELYVGPGTDGESFQLKEGPRFLELSTSTKVQGSALIYFYTMPKFGFDRSVIPGCRIPTQQN